jgi:hypothetical protein
MECLFIELPKSSFDTFGSFSTQRIPLFMLEIHGIAIHPGMVAYLGVYVSIVLRSVY